MTDKVGYRRVGDIAVLRIANPPVNALGQAVRAGLLERLEQAEGEEGLRAVLLVGDGRVFIAGADIKEFGKTPLEPHLPDLCNRIEASPLLVMASLHGVSLGGGLEVALAAHYRVAHPQARVGLPEVHLGLIPGAGGTQRLPRLTGVDAAIEAITSGRHIAAPEALKMGIIDAVEEGDPEAAGLAFTRRLLAEEAPRRPVSDMPAPAPVDWEQAEAAALKKARGQIAPGAAVRAIRASVEQTFPDGLRTERRIFRELMETEQRQGMIHTFFSQRATSALPELDGVSARPLRRVGVVGGGTMGAGIATALLLADLPVVVIEQTGDAAEAAVARIAAALDGAVARGKLAQQMRDRMLDGMLTAATDMAALAGADLVIEAVFEDMDVKRRVFAALDTVCGPEAILTTNTSYLDVGEIAAATRRPDRVIGLHFFSPAHVMKLLEIVVPEGAAPDVVATGFALGKRLGKVCVRAGVCEGFIGNRVLTAYRTAADHLVLDGATPFEVDAAMTGFGFPMGPFAMADLAGLDIGWALRKRRAATRDTRERVGRYADRLCEAGHFGQKTGTGFYVYAKGQRSGVPNEEVLDLIAAERRARGISPRLFTASDIQRRILAAMVNEGARIVEEGIARRPLDVDMVMVFGYGFPRYWGGPMKWADLQGPGDVLADILRLAKEDDYFWQPAALLEEIASRSGTFATLNA